jgi:hypothetical protein
MRTWWRRTNAGLSLFAAIFGDLRRRAWWAYRRGAMEAQRPLVATAARRRVEHDAYVPTLTPLWQGVAARALPVLDAKVITDTDGEAHPTVVVDVGDHPDVADMPRVLRLERHTSTRHALVATQWLADLDHDRVLLVVTFVEPVSATWALSFDVTRTLGVLEQIARSSDVFIIWGDADPLHARDISPSEGIHLTVTRPALLRAILVAWTERHARRT